MANTTPELAGSQPTDREPLLQRSRGSQEGHQDPPNETIAGGLRSRLYVSHFLSTWNSRVFEFGAVLYLAAIFPNNLLPMSVYALIRGLSAIILGPAVGQFIDSGNRLTVVRISIVVQRVVVGASCVVFYCLTAHLPMKEGGRVGLLILLVFLACLEKLCSIMNMVSVEKDWVVVVARGDAPVLRILNAQMRRIDLTCKLLGPLAIALIDGISTRTAITVNFAMNLVSIAIEYFAIARVYYLVPELQAPKRQLEAPDSPHLARNDERGFQHCWKHVRRIAQKSVQDFQLYFHHQTFLPSIAGALLYLTVLNFAGQMVTYLLAAGYSSTAIGLARTASVAFEVVATWVAPWFMSKIGPVRAGLWMSSWQVTMLIAGTTVFWVFTDKPIVSATGLVAGTVLSRVGLRGVDLCAQLIVQEEIEPEIRGAFSSVEAAWQSAFELLAYASTIVFYRPEQFKWPVLISVIAVTTASSVYTVFVRMRRGHLLHLGAVKNLFTGHVDRGREQERGIERITSHGDI